MAAGSRRDPQRRYPADGEIRTGLLREHVLDWLLCNFDTKGENFLFDRRGNLVSFDKEASFSHLSDKDAQDMSYDYVPHSNDTIYNVIFRRYAQGLQKLDLTKTEQFVEQVESMSEQEYMEQFLPMLEEKYGRDTRKYHENYQKILDRKTQLRENTAPFTKSCLTNAGKTCGSWARRTTPRMPGTAIFFAETRKKTCFAPHEALIRIVLRF